MTAWHRRRRTLASRWYWLLPIAVLVGIWWPEARHGWFDRSGVTDAQMAQLVIEPAGAVLERVGRIDLAELDALPPAPPTAARDLAAGWLRLPGPAPEPVSVRGHPLDYLAGPPNLLLFMASLGPENLLLRAYARGGDESNFQVALQRTLQMARHERTRWHDRSFLWNDHAVASRVSVLVELWRHMRHRPDLRAAHGTELLSFAQRSGRLLAKPDHFTVRTNHGVMQNIALLQLAAAFPHLPDATAWRLLAVDRLKLQLGFYVSPEGVVLEHSSGYHEMGTRLLAGARELLALNGLPAEPALDHAVAGARSVLRVLVRPDGKLPLVGNTHTGAVGIESGTATAPATRSDWFPVSGWAIWRSPRLDTQGSHVMLTWAKHDGHGHKRPDEGSLHFWSDGVDWITASGYWPYGDPRLEQAYSWLAANALHAPGESGGSVRTAQLMGHSDAAAPLPFGDMLRETPGGAAFRRQVLQLAPHTLLVLDFVTGSSSGSETLWTLGTDLSLAPALPAHTFQTRPLPDGRRLTLSLSSAQPGLQAIRMRGSDDPFAGWVVTDGMPRPAESVRVLHPGSDTATATLLHISNAPSAEPAAAELLPGALPERWQSAVKLEDGLLRIQRSGDHIELDLPDGTTRVLALSRADAGVARARKQLALAFAEATRLFPPWRDLWPYRIKASQLVVAAALTAELAVSCLGRLSRRRCPALEAWVTPALLLAWAATAFWLLQVYLTV